MHSWSDSRVLSIYLCTHGQTVEYYLSIYAFMVKQKSTIYLCTHGQAVEYYLSIYLSIYLFNYVSISSSIYLFILS